MQKVLPPAENVNESLGRGGTGVGRLQVPSSVMFLILTNENITVIIL